MIDIKKMSLKNLQVLVVSKLPIIRWGMIHVLQEFELDIIFWEADTEEASMELLRQYSIGMIIFHSDENIGVLVNFLAFSKEIDRKIDVVLLVNQQKPNRLPKIFENEIRAVISCESCIADIKRAFFLVLNGEVYISHVFINSIFQTLGKESEVLPHETLSVRELQVFFLLIKGESLKEIANKMTLSDKTISSYRSRILQKFTMKSNVELVKYAYERHLMY